MVTFENRRAATIWGRELRRRRTLPFLARYGPSWKWSKWGASVARCSPYRWNPFCCPVGPTAL